MAAGGEERVEADDDVGRDRWAGVVDDERRLVDDHLPGRYPRVDGVESEDGAGGLAEEVRRAAGRVDHRAKVLELAGDRVRRGVPAVAPAAPVVVVHGEAPGQQFGDADGALVERPGLEGAAHAAQGRPAAAAARSRPGGLL